MAIETAEERAAKNRAALAAWNHWKDVCWVYGLGKVLYPGQPAIGSEEEAQLLAKEIANAFRRKLRAFNGCFNSEAYGELPLDIRDMVLEFDVALHEYEICDQEGHEIWDRRHGEDNPQPRKPKCWKDYTWTRVVASKDSPLQVIRGELTGNKGAINQVVKDWILHEYSAQFKKVKDPGTGKEKLVLIFMKLDDAEQEKMGNQPRDQQDDGSVQADEAVENVAIEAISPGSNQSEAEQEDDGRGDETALEDVTAMELPRIPLAWKAELDAKLTQEHCCVLFAYMMKVVIYNDEELLKAFGCGKSAAANRLVEVRKIFSKLDEELQDWLRLEAAGAKFMKKYVEKRALLEKAGQLVLSRVKAREDHAAEGV